MRLWWISETQKSLLVRFQRSQILRKAYLRDRKYNFSNYEKKLKEVTQKVLKKAVSSSIKFVATPYLERIIEKARKEYEAEKTSGPFKIAENLIKHLRSL